MISCTLEQAHFFIISKSKSTEKREQLELCILTCYDVVHQRGWHAEDANQQVADGEVENKQVGDRAHVFAAQHDETHHPVAHHAHQENEQVGDGEDCSHRGLVEVEINIGDVLVGQRVFLQS